MAFVLPDPEALSWVLRCHRGPPWVVPSRQAGKTIKVFNTLYNPLCLLTDTHMHTHTHMHAHSHTCTHTALGSTNKMGRAPPSLLCPLGNPVSQRLPGLIALL
jgi:hypothetical protein